MLFSDTAFLYLFFNILFPLFTARPAATCLCSKPKTIYFIMKKYLIFKSETN